jgi:predicted MFS family arabinose efflux permease
VLGIPLGRVLAVAYDFRTPFLAFAAVMAVAFALVLVLVPQPDVEREGRLSPRDTLLRYPRLLAQKDAVVAAATYFLMYFSLGLLVVYLPQWLTERFPLEIALFGRPLRILGLPVDFIATLFLVGGAASVVTGPAAGTVSDRIGRKPLILASCLGLAAVTVAVTYLVTARWVAYALYVAIMVLFAMRMTPLQALLTAIVPGKQRGSLLSLTIAVGQIGTAAGAALGGVLYAGAGYRANTFASAAVILLMAALVWRALPEPEGVTG